MTYCFGDPGMVRKPQPNDWSEEEIKRLRVYAKSGISIADAANKLGRSRGSVKNKSFRMSIRWATVRGDAWSNSEVALLRKYSKTCTTQEAARLLRRSQKSVEQKASRLHISFRKYGELNHKTKFSTAKIAEMFELRRQGWMLKQISERCGVGWRQISLILSLDSRYRDSLPMLMKAGTLPKP